jgi:opacity protein-like surface antigen
MKRLTLFALMAFALANISIFAADPQVSTTKTLFDSEINLSGWGGPYLNVVSLDDGPELYVGGKGGLLINKTFTIGLAGAGMVTSHRVDEFQPGKDTSIYLRDGYGGLYLEWVIAPDEIIHFTISSIIGGGGASYTYSYEDAWDDDYDDDDCDDWALESSGYFVWTIGAGVEANITKWMKIELAASYKLTSDMNLTYHKSEDLNGVNGQLTFKFGDFE